MTRPSGENLGKIAWPNSVSWRGAFPSLSEIQTSDVPLRSEMKAIFVPSGETWGMKSSRVDATILCGGEVASRKAARAPDVAVLEPLGKHETFSSANRKEAGAVEHLQRLWRPSFDRNFHQVRNRLSYSLREYNRLAIRRPD